MASADKFIGKTFYAKKPLVRYRYPGDLKTTFAGEKKLKVFQPGELIGVVYSWIVNKADGKLYWMFGQPGKFVYFIKHEEGAIELTQQIKNVLKVAEATEKAQTEAELLKADQLLKENKGDFAYYIEKYGKVVLTVIVGTVLLKTIIEKKL